MASNVSKKDEAFRHFALEGAPLRVLLSTCAPLALFQALQSIFKILDAMMASHIGSDAVSAVACLSQITLMITALGSGLAVGGCIKISEAYGRGDYEQVRHRVATVYTMAVAVSIVLAVTLIPFAAPFLRLLQTPEDLITTGKGYFQTTIRLNDGSAVALSVGKYFTPGGKSLADVGVTPDKWIETDEETELQIYYGRVKPQDDPYIQQAVKLLKNQ